MRKLFFAILGVMLALVVVVFLFADVKKDIKNATVQDIKENAVFLDKNDTFVTLTGTISSQISRKKFWFEDKTGEIVIEVKNNLLPMVPATNQIEVEIRGNVDCETESGGGVKINVDELILDDEEDIQLL